MSTKIQELKKKIALLSAELHSEFHTDYAEWNPRFPWVLVHVLPKEQKQGLIWVNVHDDSKRSNKVTLEGVVVKLWKADHLKVKTELKLGDLVLFPHSGGQPFANQSKNEFRLIKEYIPIHHSAAPDFVDDGHIFAKLEYSDKTIDKELIAEIKRLKKRCKTDKELLEGLRANFVIYPNHSRTLSGV